MHTPRAAYPCHSQEGSRGGGHFYMAISQSRCRCLRFGVGGILWRLSSHLCQRYHGKTLQKYSFCFCPARYFTLTPPRLS